MNQIPKSIETDKLHLPAIVVPLNVLLSEIEYEVHLNKGRNTKFLDITNLIDCSLYDLLVDHIYLTMVPKEYTDFCTYHGISQDNADVLQDIVRDTLIDYLNPYWELTAEPITYTRVMGKSSLTIVPFAQENPIYEETQNNSYGGVTPANAELSYLC